MTSLLRNLQRLGSFVALANIARESKRNLLRRNNDFLREINDLMQNKVGLAASGSAGWDFLVYIDCDTVVFGPLEKLIREKAVALREPQSHLPARSFFFDSLFILIWLNSKKVVTAKTSVQQKCV